MENTIYIVYASKEFNYSASHSSIVFTTLCQKQAVSFAKKYFENANKLLNSFMFCDSVSVSVISSVIGKPNTESIVWTSNGFSVSTENNYNNFKFSIDPEKSLINKMISQQKVDVNNYLQIKPTFSFAIGLSQLEIKSEQHTFDFTQYLFDEFSGFYSNFDSQNVVNHSLSKGFISAIDQDSQSNENKKSWDLYRLYEQKYFSN